MVIVHGDDHEYHVITMVNNHEYPCDNHGNITMNIHVITMVIVMVMMISYGKHGNNHEYPCDNHEYPCDNHGHITMNIHVITMNIHVITMVT